MQLCHANVISQYDITLQYMYHIYVRMYIYIYIEINKYQHTHQNHISTP